MERDRLVYLLRHHIEVLENNGEDSLEAQQASYEATKAIFVASGRYLSINKKKLERLVKAVLLE